MTALTQDRLISEREGRFVSDPLAASAVIFSGAMYVLDASGDAIPATSVSTATVRAVALQRADATEDPAVEGSLGLFCFDSVTGAGAVTRADIYRSCYVADDQTVQKTGTCKAGTVIDVDACGVWVRVGA